MWSNCLFWNCFMINKGFLVFFCKQFRLFVKETWFLGRRIDGDCLRCRGCCFLRWGLEGSGFGFARCLVWGGLEENLVGWNWICCWDWSFCLLGIECFLGLVFLCRDRFWFCLCLFEGICSLHAGLGFLCLDGCWWRSLGARRFGCLGLFAVAVSVGGSSRVRFLGVRRSFWGLFVARVGFIWLNFWKSMMFVIFMY